MGKIIHPYYEPPPLVGRQSVRDALREFLLNEWLENPVSVMERLVNKLVDIAVEEAMEKMKNHDHRS